MNSATDTVLRSAEPGVTILSLNAGPVNALDAGSLEELRRALHGLRSLRGGIVIKGNGRAFCAGFDLRSLMTAKKANPAATTDLLQRYSGLLAEVVTHPRPIVAAVSGAAIAAGAILAYAADALVSADTSKIGLPELSLGLPFQPLAFEILRASLGSALPGLLASGKATLITQLPITGSAEVVGEEQVMPLAIATARRLAIADATTFMLAKRQRWSPVLNVAAASASTEVEVRSVWERADFSEILRRNATRASSLRTSW